MTTILLLLLILSPVSSVVMVINQHKLNKYIDKINSNLKDVKTIVDTVNSKAFGSQVTFNSDMDTI